MVIKLDMSKAYHRVEWTHLENVLNSMSFSAKWVQLILRCVTTASFVVLVYVFPHSHFWASKGLRQRDPLSPYLFIPCAEVFSAFLKRSLEQQSLHGIKICPKAPILPHPFFVDDNIIFALATTEEVGFLLRLLKTYEMTSGQRINLDKSELSLSQNVPTTKIEWPCKGSWSEGCWKSSYIFGTSDYYWLIEETNI